MNVRLRYEKMGVMQFLSHLEVMKTWEQLFRRGGIPMLYTEGFNPKPKLNFALPLAVGIQARNDYLEIEVQEGFYLEQFLSLDMPPGLKITGAKEVTGKPLMASVASADFQIYGQLSVLEEGLQRSTLVFQKHTKKGLRTKDAKELILAYQFRADSLWVHLKAGSVDNLKPTDLLSTLVERPEDVFAYDIIRNDIYDESNQSIWLR